MSKLNVQFDDELSKKVNDLAQSEKISKTEILRKALATYDYLVTQKDSGGKIFLLKNDKAKSLKEIILP